VLEPVETGHLQSLQEVTGSESTSNQAIPEVKAGESKGDEDQESADQTRDATSKTSTRLVKFQLFETKSVFLAVLYV